MLQIFMTIKDLKEDLQLGYIYPFFSLCKMHVIKMPTGH